MAEGDFRTTSKQVGQLKVRNKLGKMVPLATLASVKSQGGPGDVHAIQYVPDSAGER